MAVDKRRAGKGMGIASIVCGAIATVLGAAAFTPIIVLSIIAVVMGFFALSLGAWRTSVLGFAFTLSSVAINPSLFPMLRMETVATISALIIGVLAVTLYINYRRATVIEGDLKST